MLFRVMCLSSNDDSLKSIELPYFLVPSSGYKVQGPFQIVGAWCDIWAKNQSQNQL